MIPTFTPAHEYAEIFSLHEDDIPDLAKRIGANGLREPCVTLAGKMLDGRRRERACFKAGVDPTYREFGTRESDGTDPLEFVIDLNLHRRHLGEGERALAAARYATAKAGKREIISSQNATITGNDLPPTNAQAAEKFEVSESKVDRAKKVVANGTPVLQAAVADGTISVSDAANIASEPARSQNEAVKDVKTGKASTAKKAIESKKPKSGQPIFDDRAVMDMIGKLVRSFDARAAVYGKGPKHQACINALDKVLAAFTQWQVENT